MSSAEDDLEDDDLTDSVPRVVPAYPDDELRQLGEELASLYDTRDFQSGREVDEEIARVRARMRKGPRLHPGEFLGDGRYRLIDQVQRGGTDGYWRAWDRRDAEYVFVRVFHGEWVADRASVERFMERGRALAALDHPGIGRLLEATRSDDGFVYLVTQLFATGNLGTVTGLDHVAVLQIVVECARALEHAHGQGLVHGDVRPANLMLAPDGVAHLAGFSVAPRRPNDASLFQAPESAERGYEPAPASDVYALGMTALQALKGGELPFWVLRDPGRLIRELAVPEPVQRVLQRSIEWDLAVRYGTPGAMLDELLADPELVEALAVRARERGRCGVAAGHYETLLGLQPQRGVEIRTILGDVYTALGAYDPAFTHLLVALESTQDVESLFGPLRTVAERTGDWGRLADALRTQARARDVGRRVVLRTELARINQHELQNAEAAAETWGQLLADHRTPVQAGTALRALQGLARDRGDWGAFVGYGKELLEYAPEDEQARVEYAVGRACLEHLDDEDQGLHFIDRAEARGWSEVDLGPRMQRIRARRGQWQRVIQLMVQQAETQEIGEASPTLLRAGIIASSVHLEEETFKVYRALLERAPRHVVALRHLARLHHRAHEYDHALEYYERLWDTYRGKPSEEPEASERAADCTAYAVLLLRRGHATAAAERLEEALRLNPNHVPSLQLAGPLLLGRGDTAAAAGVFERLLALFKTVELSSQKIEACLGMGDLCWVQGRLTAAMGWYNRALELDPFSVVGWWGLAKVALAARGGHPGADRAPWVMAVPKRYTSNEALARLVAGMIAPETMVGWLRRSALGRALLEGGDTPMRMACAVVDVMLRHEVVSPDLFRRLGEACPEWAEAIDDVQRLWFAGGASTFPVARSYTWSERRLGSDFEPLARRTVLPPELSPPPVVLEDLRSRDAWDVLLGGEPPPPPPPFTMNEPRDDTAPAPRHGPTVALVRDGTPWLVLGRDRLEARIGRDPDNELVLTEDASVRPHHARMYRQGGRVYFAVVGDGRLQVDGEDRAIWRLVGGERVTIGETRLRCQVYPEEETAPAETPPVPRAPGPAFEGEAPEPELAPEPEPEPEPELEPEPEPQVVMFVDDPSEEASISEKVDVPPEDASTRPDPSLESEPEPEPAEPVESPAWLQQALAAEDAAMAEAVDEPCESSDEEIIGIVPAVPEPPPAREADATPTVVTAAIPSSLAMDEPSVPAPPRAGGVFDFPADVQDDDLDALAPETTLRPVGLSGPTMVPIERDEMPQSSDEVPEEASPAALEFLSGAERGQSVEIRQRLTVGQSRHCDLSIPGDSRLSPTHCVVELTSDNRYVLRDENSANGTVVNSKRVTEVELTGDEVIMVGRTVLRFKLEEGS